MLVGLFALFVSGLVAMGEVAGLASLQAGDRQRQLLPHIGIAHLDGNHLALFLFGGLSRIRLAGLSVGVLVCVGVGILRLGSILVGGVLVVVLLALVVIVIVIVDLLEAQLHLIAHCGSALDANPRRKVVTHALEHLANLAFANRRQKRRQLELSRGRQLDFGPHLDRSGEHQGLSVLEVYDVLDAWITKRL